MPSPSTSDERAQGSRPRDRSRVPRTVLVVVVVLAVALSGVGLVGLAAYSYLHEDQSGSAVASPPPPSETGPMPAAPASLDRFYRQRLHWRTCGINECTTLTVPLDYAHPDGRTIRLSVLRVPAGQRSRRVGQLVVDPGGPGASAIDYAGLGSTAFGQTIARYYDLVGMDPRGVGQSTPIHCLGTAGLDAYFAADPEPDTPAEVTALDRVNRSLADGCERRSGALIAHVSTVEAAKDMDILRAALGERRLDYFGASYGTLLGATYAGLFPTHVRRMVLDGALDPALSATQTALGQARGFETALRSYLADCIVKGGCPLGTSVDGAAARLARLIEGLTRHPLPTQTPQPLTAGWATAGVFEPLYTIALWPALTAALSAALAGDGGKLLELGYQYAGRGSTGYTDNSNEALVAVNCLDRSDYVTGSQVPATLPAFERASPTFGRVFAYGQMSCAEWPVRGSHPPAPIHAAGSLPIVVIGTTRDPATPYAWAKALAAELDSGVLITRDGDGHTGFNRGNSCVDGAVEHYLLTGTPPRKGLSC